ARSIRKVEAPMKQSQRPRVVAPRRLAPLAIAAALAFVAGLVVGALYVPPAGRVAGQFAAAWERGHYAATYPLLSDDARGRAAPEQFAQAYRDAARMLT